MDRSIVAKLWGVFGVFCFVFLLVSLSYLIQGHIGFFERLLGEDFLGLAIFIFLNVAGIVFAPLTVIPLVVVVAGVWGGFVASLSVWIAWVLGSVFSFLLARVVGVRVISRFISMNELYKFEKRFSFVSSFWGVFFLRMIIPVEILSYGLGIFSQIGFWRYTVASMLGLIPVSIVFGYLGVLDFVFQLVLGLIVLNGFLIVIIWQELKK
jgi:uncharacterized membrane protein YdjX (TVP38/TMEM64 family)